jgi:molecular chaperone Hsp33
VSAAVEFFHDHLTRHLLTDIPVRVLEADLRDTARESIARCEAGEVGALAIAQALVATALLSGHIKGEEKLTFQLVGRGHLGHVLVDCNAEGDLRARVQYPQASAMGKSPHERLVNALGAGQLLVIKSDGQRELYRGASPYAHSDIAGALELYLAVSEQVASVVWIDVAMGADGLERARGLMVQALGGGDRQWFEARMKGVAREAIQERLASGARVAEVVEGMFEAPSKEVDTQALRYRCRCSEERVLAMLFALGADELTEMLMQDGKAEVTCDFCMTQYQVDAPALERLIALARKAAEPEMPN